MTHTLKISHSTSRARDTDGYPIVSVRDEQGRRFRCMGGGYDMFGTVLAEWITAVYPDRVKTLADRAYYTSRPGVSTIVNRDGIYGVHYVEEDDRVWIDGAVGTSTVERMARDELDLRVRALTNRQGHTTGWTVEDLREG